MRAGRMDRAITIEKRTITTDTYGADTVTWSTLAEVRAEIRTTNSKEILAAGVQPIRTVLFRVRHREDIDHTMRVLWGIEYYNIRTVNEIGRRAGLELVGEAEIS